MKQGVFRAMPGMEYFVNCARVRSVSGDADASLVRASHALALRVARCLSLAGERDRASRGASVRRRVHAAADR